MTDQLAGEDCQDQPVSSSWREQQFSPGRFAGLLMVWLAVMVFLKVWGVPWTFRHLGPVFSAWQAQHTALLTRALGMASASTDNLVYTSQYQLKITQSCSGVDYLLYMAGLVALFPFRLKQRWLWIVVMPVLLYVLLLLRLVFMLALGNHFPEIIKTVHDYWNIGYIVLFCLLWLTFMMLQYRLFQPPVQTIQTPQTTDKVA